MGRAGRPSDMHPALRELGEEGLPNGWREYWQGKRSASTHIISLVVPTMHSSQIDRLEGEFISRREWASILLRHTWQQSQLHEADPLVQALWKQEELRFQRWIDACEKATEEESILRTINLEEIKSQWFDGGFMYELRSWIEYGQEAGTYFPRPSVLHHFAQDEQKEMRAGSGDTGFWSKLEAELLLWKERDPESYQLFIAEEATEILSDSRRAMKSGALKELEADLLHALCPDYVGPLPCQLASSIVSQGGLRPDYADYRRGVLFRFLAENSWKEISSSARGTADSSVVRDTLLQNTEDDVLNFSRSILLRQFKASRYGDLHENQNKWQEFWEGRIEEIINQADGTVGEGVAVDQIDDAINNITLNDLQKLADGDITLADFFDMIIKR